MAQLADPHVPGAPSVARSFPMRRCGRDPRWRWRRSATRRSPPSSSSTSRRRGGHGALVFVLFAIAVVGSRLLGSRLPDVIGPRRSAVAAAGAETAGLAIIALASHWTVAAAGAMLVVPGGPCSSPRSR